MDGEDPFAALDVRTVDDNAAVEAARAQQRRVEHVRPVGGSDEDDAFVRLEAVHLDEQLIQRLLALVMAAAEAGAAMTADRVDLVDEDDAGGVLLALFEQVANARRADADEHLDEVGAADREERNIGLTGHGPRQQRLPRSGRAHQQDALRDAAAKLLELLRLLQELDDFLQLFFRFIDAGDVLERHLLLRAGRELRPALAEREGLVPAALHLPHDEDPEADHEKDRRPGVEERRPRAGGLAACLYVHIVRVQLIGEAFVLRRGIGPELLLAIAAAADERPGDVVAFDGDGGDLFGPDVLQELRKRDLVVTVL